MSETNGTATTPREQLRDQRIANRLIVERIKGKRLERARRLLESSYDWVTPYTNMLDQQRREPSLAGPAQAWHRKRGRNYPIFQNETELGVYRAAARVLCATNSYAIGMQEGLSSFILGTGITYRTVGKNDAVPKELVRACQAEIDDFLDREQWYGGELPGIEEELDQRSREDGEWFLAHFAEEQTGLTSVRIIEPEQVTEPPNKLPEDEEYDWSFGVKTKKTDVQKPLGYYVVWGDTPHDGEDMDADQVIHFRRNSKRGIKRGMTDFAFDTYDSLNLGGLLRTNMSDAAAQQAAIVGVRQHATASQEQIQEFHAGTEDDTRTNPSTGGQESNRQYRRGHWEDIDSGQTYVAGPLAQNQPIHIQVLQACLRGGAVRWNAPEWLVSGLHDTSSFASSLTAESPFTRRIQRAQRGTCAVHRATMFIVLRNRANAGKLIDANGRAWTWDEVKALVDVKAEAQSPQVRDQAAEANTAAIEIPLGVDSRQRYVQSKGRDWDQVQKDNEAFAAETGGSGQPLPLPAA